MLLLMDNTHYVTVASAINANLTHSLVADLEIWKGGFSGECSGQRHEVPICLPREAWKKIFTVIFQLPGWAVVAPSCFALHCHYSLFSVQSMTVCMTLAMHMRSCSRRGLIPFQLSVQKNVLNVYLPLPYRTLIGGHGLHT